MYTIIRVFTTYTWQTVFIIAILGYFFTIQKVFASSPSVDTPQFTNPLTTDSFQELLYALLRILMVIGVPVVIFFIIYAGFMYVMARGNAEQVQTSTKALTYAIIGGLIILGATVITGIVTNLVGSFMAD